MRLVRSSSVVRAAIAAAALGSACSGADPTSETSLPVGAGSAAGGTTAGDASGTGAGAASVGGTAGSASVGGTGVGSGGIVSGAGASAAGAGGTIATPASTGGTTTIMDAPCEKKVRTAGKTVPDFMIVLDRSASMQTTINADVKCNDPTVTTPPAACQNIDCATPQWMVTTACGGTMPAGIDRWTPAVSALKSLTMMFEAKVSFGLTIFPGEGTGRGSECTTGVQRVAVGTNNASKIATALDGSKPGGYTPTSATLQEVLKQIMAKKTSPDSEVPPQYVLLVTDGSPNCVGNNPLMDQAAHQATVKAIDDLAKVGVKTFVIGYDATVDPNLAKQLTEYAQHGGSNNFFAVQDGPSLVSKFSEITSVAAECTYTLDMKPNDKRYVRVELDKETLPVDSPDGWSLSEKTVTINGAACTKLRDGSKTHTLAVTVECAVIDIQ